MLEATYVLLFVVNPLTVLFAVLLTKGVVMSDFQSAVDEITAVLVKARGEILAEIDSLEVALNSGVAPDLSALRAVADSLDAIVPDAVVEVVEEAAPSEGN